MIALIKEATTLGVNAVLTDVGGRSQSPRLLKNGHPKWCCECHGFKVFCVEREGRRKKGR